MALPSTHAASGAEELPEGGSGEDEALPSFLSAHSLAHLTSALQGLSLQALLAPDDRLSLLSLLQSLGTLALRDRQALANAVSRERRRRGAPLASRGKAADPPPPPAGKSPPPAAPAAPAAPPPPPPPPPRAVPSDFTAAEGSEAWRRAPSEPTRQAVCRCVLSELSHYEVREGQVRLAGARRPLLSRWMGALAECADPLCGCYRLARRGPRERPARVRFRELVVECVARAAAGGGAVRYVTLGSGGLLTDFEILCGLYDRGLRVEAVVAVDRAYTGSNPALRQIATFFSPAVRPPPRIEPLRRTSRGGEPSDRHAVAPASQRVTSFSSVVELERAAREAPELYGRATALVQCDSPISRSICQSAAACVLSEGGLAFKMDNGADCCAKAECWRRARLASGGLEDVPIQPMLQHYGPRRPPLSAAELASLCGTRLFTVLHHPAVVLRASPAVSAPVIDSRRKGEQVLVDEVCDGWLKISKEDALLLNPSVIAAQEEKWLLRDGSSLGFGLLASEELCRPLY